MSEPHTQHKLNTTSKPTVKLSTHESKTKLKPALVAKRLTKGCTFFFCNIPTLCTDQQFYSQACSQGQPTIKHVHCWLKMAVGNNSSKVTAIEKSHFQRISIQSPSSRHPTTASSLQYEILNRSSRFTRDMKGFVNIRFLLP